MTSEHICLISQWKEFPTSVKAFYVKGFYGVWIYYVKTWKNHSIQDCLQQALINSMENYIYQLNFSKKNLYLTDELRWMKECL